MYSLLAETDVFIIFSLVIVLAVIAVIFEEILCGVADFVYSFVSKVKKRRVVDPQPLRPLISVTSKKGVFDLYTRWRSRIRKNVFKIHD